ncbi:MAG: hypothetical protein WBA17_18170 [Saprospiraceae bacterium]
MKEDIIQQRVEDVAMVIAPRENGVDEEVWDTYLINLRDEPMHNVLIASKGYGQIDGRTKSTTVLRHFFEEVKPYSLIKIEPIQRELFALTNEYWISFNEGDYMYDKKYVFVPGSIAPEHFTPIPLLKREGVMIR